MDRNTKFFLLASVTSAVCAGAYIFWGPSGIRSKRKKKDWVPGLYNLGNSCFLNAVLQGLAGCTVFIKWLDTRPQLRGHQHDPFTFAFILRNILKRLNNDDIDDSSHDSDNVVSPVDVITALTARRWVITSEEQDAHEFFHVVTTTLEEELKSHTSVLSLLDVKDIEQQTDDRNMIFRSRSCVGSCLSLAYNSPTRGLLASRLICCTCGYNNPLRLDSFDSISLSIPKQWNRFHLEDLLKEWSSSELVDNVICDGCTQLQKETLSHQPTLPCKSSFLKQLSIVKLPKCLCLHLLRTVWLNNGMVSKRYDYVSFPEFLFMDDYLFHKKQRLHPVYNFVPMTFGLVGGNGHNSERCDLKLNGQLIFDSALVCSGKNRSLVKGDSSNYSLLRKGEHLYQLKAVLVHEGDTYSGHFITYRRGPSNSANQHKWFCTSDTLVTEVPASVVMRANAYMLLYEYVSG